MIIQNIKRVIKFGFQGFYRNAWLSIVTVIILTLALFMLSLLITVQTLGNQAVEAIVEKVDVAVFFTQNTSNEQLDSIVEQLATRSEILNIRKITAEEAYEEFKVENADDPIIRESLEELGLNPLGPVLVIKAQTLDDYPAILEFFDNDSIRPLIQDKERDFESKQIVIQRLSNIIDQTKNLGIILVGIFALIAFMVIYNTLRINIYTHREEIGIMKLVGASNSFVRYPFIFESIIYAITATLITSLVFYLTINFSAPLVDNFFRGYDFSLLQYFNDNLVKIILLQAISAILLSTISAAIAVGRYIQV
ncbi:MAG: permease-like cell division protein FtsX [bacterium]